MVCGRGIAVGQPDEKEDLRSMSHRALQLRAEQLGVPDDALDGAEQKAAVVALIEAAQQGADEAAQPEGGAGAAIESSVDSLAQLKEELDGMTLRALQKRASELGSRTTQHSEHPLPRPASAPHFSQAL